jgi:hypothetical protein
VDPTAPGKPFHSEHPLFGAEEPHFFIRVTDGVCRGSQIWGRFVHTPMQTLQAGFHRRALQPAVSPTVLVRDRTSFLPVAVITLLLRRICAEPGGVLSSSIPANESSAILATGSSYQHPSGWAWLQGNSRARRRHSAVPSHAGFGFPRTLPALPFATAQTMCS